MSYFVSKRGSSSGMQHRQMQNFTEESTESDRSSLQAGLLSEKPTTSTAFSTRSSWITPRVLSDFTIGLSDGLTVPFALTAGLSTLGNGKIVVVAGLAELVAGAISMGVAGYLAAKGERDAQLTSTNGVQRMILAESEESLAFLAAKLRALALPEEIVQSAADYYSTCPPTQLLDTLLRFEDHDAQAEVQVLRPWLSGMTIATAYFLGGSIPLMPYMLFSVEGAFTISIIITAFVLFCFGSVKGPLAGSKQSLRKCLASGLEMLVLGGLATSAALICVKLLHHYRE